MPELSVVIVTYNSADVIRDCLASLLDPRLQIIVVDNASADETVSIVRDFPDVQLIKSGSNLGYGAGNNLGAAAATSTYLAIVNPDLTATPDDLLTLVAYLRENPDVGVVGPRMHHGDGKPVMSARPAYTVGRVLAKYFALERFNEQWVYADYGRLAREVGPPLATHWLQGSCLVMRLATFQNMNGFDDSFFLFAEDVDLCERIRAAGQRVVYQRAVTVQHLVSTSVRRASLISTRAYHISPLIYFGKRDQRGAVLLLKAGFTVELGLKVLMRLLRGDTTERRVYAQVLRDVWRWRLPVQDA